MGRWDRETRDRDHGRRSPANTKSSSSSSSVTWLKGSSSHSSKRNERGRTRSRSRSRSPRDRGSYERRDRDRDRKKDRERRRSRSRERSDRHRDGDGQKGGIEEIVGKEVNLETFDIEEQQRKLELLMQQRRERVEKWRQQQAKERGTETGDQASQPGEKCEDNESKPPEKKTWTLEGEDDDEDEEESAPLPMEEGEEREFKELKKENEDDEKEPEPLVKKVIGIKKKPEIIKPQKPKPEVKQEEDDDIDPLDAFMQSIQDEVKSSKAKTIQQKQVGDKKVTVVVGVAKKKEEDKKKVKGELVEQNQDALEYSSEEEPENDLQATMTDLQNKQASKIKRLTTISLNDLNYKPFRKDFYIEVPELAKMTDEEVAAYRLELEGIQVKGKGCPKPIKTWAQCGVSRRIMEALKKHGYEKPTPIQAQAIPAIMSGRDIIGIAKTGSGKTLAFVIPMLRHILDQPPLEPGDGPISIIMAPTRELATQIWSEIRKFSKSLGLRVVAVYGGTPISEQIGELKPGAEIVVCTPGRMIDMLAANSGRVTNLRRCTYVVLDEADRMFDMGFEPQVMRVIDGIRPDRQTVMFSATFPRIMEALARRILNKPLEIQVGGRSVVCKEVEQQVMIIEEDDKFLKLLECLGKHVDKGTAIVFVDRQENADLLLKELMHASYTCLALHGGIDQSDRDSIIIDFKAGKVKVLVATSVAARGLDVKHCICVINYDCPNHYEDYVHRCGRTGRAGNKGFAYTFVTPNQGRYAGEIIKALELSEVPVPQELKNLWEEYKNEQEAAGKKVKTGSAGFSGKGFKFDEAEAQLTKEKQKYQKAALGLQDSDEEDPEDDIDQEIENMLAPKKSVKQVSIQKLTSTAAPGVAGPAASSSQTASEKLELAKKLASRITGNLKQKETSQAEAFLKGESLSLAGAGAVSMAKSIAEQRAERLHAKLNYIPKDMEYTEDGEMVRKDEDEAGHEVFQRFEEELEINEFPQQARWKVTSKEAIQQISEYSEAGITVRGTYFPPGKEPGPGERKLYLAIEGTSDLAVSRARAEIIRLIKEELLKMQNSNHAWRQRSAGRYQVV